jgi:hypothetical protein
MFLFQWHFKLGKSASKPHPTSPFPSRAHDTNAILAKRPNTVKVSSDAALGPSKSGPRGRTVSHPALIPGKPNSGPLGRRTRHSATLALSKHSHSMSGSAIAPGLLDDPAFSSNPLLNPNFSAPYHKTFSQTNVIPPPARWAHPESTSSFYLADEDEGVSQFQLRQPPNSPQESPVDHHISSKPPFVHSPPITAFTPSIPSLSSTSSTSHVSTVPSTPPTPPTEQSLPDPMPNKSHTKSSRPPLASEPRPTHEAPVSARRNTAPDLHVIERPVLPSRPITTPGDPRKRVDGFNGLDQVSARTISKNGLLRPRELDRIDELDETDPLGVPWHHGGPYEAIHRSMAHGAQSDTVSRLEKNPDYDGQNHRLNKVFFTCSLFWLI